MILTSYVHHSALALDLATSCFLLHVTYCLPIKYLIDHLFEDDLAQSALEKLLIDIFSESINDFFA